VARRTAIGLAAIVLAVVLLAFGAYGGDDDDTGYFIIASLIAIAVAIAFFWGVLPRITQPGLGALIIGILAVGTIIVFWLGLPTILGAAAIALGLDARESSAEPGKATVGIVLGALAVVAHVVLAFAG
jgi:hypothetical protein